MRERKNKVMREIEYRNDIEIRKKKGQRRTSEKVKQKRDVIKLKRVSENLKEMPLLSQALSHDLGFESCSKNFKRTSGLIGTKARNDRMGQF